jgi:hypothetical protein
VPLIGLSFLDVYGWGWGGGEQAPLPSAPRRDDSEPGESDDCQEDDSGGDGGGQLRRYNTFFPFVTIWHHKPEANLFGLVNICEQGLEPKVLGRAGKACLGQKQAYFAFLSLTIRQKATAFVHSKPFVPSLIFVSKACSIHLRGGEHLRGKGSTSKC